MNAFLLHISLLASCYAVIPSGEIKIHQTAGTVYVAPGTFGKSLLDESSTIYRKLVIPAGDSHGCDPIIPMLPKRSEYYLLSARGNCSFEDKAVAAEAVGAKAVVIYNDLEGIYQGNDFADESDYECDNGMGYVDEIMSPVYSDEMNAAMPTECTKDSKCDSGRCVLTNHTDENGTKVCCAWDLYITMGGSLTDDSAIGIPAVFIRMRDADTLLAIPEIYTSKMDVALFSRSNSVIDFASILVWLIAVCTVSLGASKAAEEDRISYHETKQIYEHVTNNTNDNGEATGGHDAPPTITPHSSPPRPARQIAGVRSYSSLNTREEDSNQSDQDQDQDMRDLISETHSVHSEIIEGDIGTMDITFFQAIGFVLVSSCFLLLLYFVNLYAVVTVMYLGAAACAVTVVLFYPPLKAVMYPPNLRELTSQPANMFDVQYDWALLLGGLTAAALSVVWYFCSSTSWVWVVQDLMGVSVCVCFLCAIRLPNLKVAATLLLLAFFYDIFFVFISPYFFESSVMVAVAEGPTVDTHDDENYCEKYPDDSDCTSTTLPMLIVVPAFSSYLSSESMLGLGDIVLPGLLIVWAARYDMRRHGSLSSEAASRGYLPMALFAYAVGLMLANLAVSYFSTGQPALLYIVPLVLGSILYRASRAGTLAQLYERLPPMKTVAMPLGYEEQEALLSRNEVVQAEATWRRDRGTSAGVNVVILGEEKNDEKSSDYANDAGDRVGGSAVTDGIGDICDRDNANVGDVLNSSGAASLDDLIDVGDVEAPNALSSASSATKKKIPKRQQPFLQSDEEEEKKFGII